MIGFILKEGLEDNGFIGEKTEGIDPLKKRQEEYLSALSEEERSDVERASRAYVQSKKSMILIGPGPWSHADSEKIAIAASNLALLTGHIGKESSGILLLLEKCNSQGATDMEMDSDGIGMENLLKKTGEGHLKALYLTGKDPSLSSKELKNLELLVVQDLFMTDAAKEANVILPGCSFVEKSGTYTNLERRVQKLHPLRQPEGRSKSDFEIFLQLLRLLEVQVAGETPEAIFLEIAKSVPHYQSIQDGEQWPKGSGYLYGERFPMGKAKFIPLAQPQPELQPEGYPFSLIQAPSLFYSGGLSLRSENLKKVMEKPCLEMNIEDAQSLKVENGETVQVSTQKGKSFKLKVKVSSRPARYIAAIPSSSSLIEERACWAKVEKVKKT
jgi:predicted molibdopterin-dependent oxidoreductase YjgC